MIVYKTYRYRLCPTPSQEAALIWTLDRCRELYNACLQERRDADHMCGVSLNRFTQQRQLPGIKEVRPEYAELDAQLLQDVVRRADYSFATFFRKMKAGQKAGFPRFQGRGRYNSITFLRNGWRIVDERLVLRGIGSLKVRWSCPIGGTVKTVTIRRDGEQWHVSFACLVELPDMVADSTKPEVGLDMGVEYFVTLSTGEHIANPCYYRKSAAVLTRRQRALDRKKRGSTRRKKAKVLVAKIHRKIRSQRKDFHRKTARLLVARHRLVAVEVLHIAGLVRRPTPILATTEDGNLIYAPNGATAKSGLNRSINDAGWGQFLRILTHKAAEAGVVLIAVNPAGTSQTCSSCGAVGPKPLSERWHVCEHCGCSLQRDVNAAINILRAGQALQAGA